MMNKCFAFLTIIVAIFSSFGCFADESNQRQAPKTTESLQYVWEKGDQWGRVLLSLGNKNIWGRNGALIQIQANDNPQLGQLVNIPSTLVRLPCNVRMIAGQIQIIRKISKQSDLLLLQQRCRQAD